MNKFNKTNSKINFYKNNGFLVIDLLNKNQIKELEKKILNKINSNLKFYDSKKLSENSLKNFHLNEISSTDNKYIFDPKKRYIHLNKEFLKKIKKNKIISSILNSNWGHSRYSVKWVASLKKKQIRNNVCGFRICPPKKKGVGVHIDMHVGGKIIYEKKCLKSLWIPLTGFKNNSTLRISPKSHLSNHPISKLVNQNKYISNIFMNNYVKKFKFQRLNLKPGQAILFHSNLLHGGSDNGDKISRVSLEVRLYNLKTNYLWMPKKN